jgi:hypothetical protein
MRCGNRFEEFLDGLKERTRQQAAGNCFVCWKERELMSSEIVAEGGSNWPETPPMSLPLRHAIGEVVERQKWLDKLANPVQN